MTVELAIQTMIGWEGSVELARWAERRGLTAFAVADHYLAGRDRSRPAWDQLTVLGGLARETSEIELVSLVSPISFRHPAVMYKVGVTLDEMSGGRFTLGAGTGWLEEEHDAFGLELWDMRERFDRLEDALGYLRSAVDGRGEGHDGPFYRLEPFSPQPVPERLRLLVGGSGPRRTPTLAGRFADEFNVISGGETDLGTKIRRARESAADAGRDPDEPFCSTAFPPVVAEDEAELARRMREMAQRRGVDPDRLADRLTSSGVPFGTPEMLADGIAPLTEAGIRRIYLQVAFLGVEEIARVVDLVEDAIAR